MVAADSIENNTAAKATTIPESAKGPAIPAAKGYLVQEIRDGLYWVTDGTYNTMFLVTAKGVVAVDAPPSIGQNYLKAIKEVTDKPVKYVIYSHSHLDHIGAAAAIFKDATFIAHEEVAKELQRAHELATAAGNATFASQLPPIPTITFKENYTISLPKLGSENQNQTLQLAYYGNNHVPGNIFIYAPNQKVLMLVDIVFPGWVPFMQLAIAQDVTGFIQAHDIALRYNFDTFVGGHLTRLGTREDVQIQKQFIMDLITASAKANAAVSFSDIAKQLGNTSDTWLFYNTYVNAVTKKCTDEMMTKWGDRLGGAQAFMPSHCTAMTEALRVDPSVVALAQGVQVS
jgi:glyoxylase-like metal-dependent hydrolase (beta-lactamase superfamily II)